LFGVAEDSVSGGARARNVEVIMLRVYTSDNLGPADGRGTVAAKCHDDGQAPCDMKKEISSAS